MQGVRWILIGSGKWLGLTLVALVALCSVHSLMLCPIYDFPETTSFSGPVWYNPYGTIDTTQWKLGNFQVQSLAWGGITNGSNNPASRVFDVYDSLGYDIITISDYMSINPYTTADRPLIPVYEHGYGAFKTHQVCLGAHDVVALDYPLFQTRSNKQHILNQLRQTSEVVAIAHPSLRRAYSHQDMAKLTGYQLVEAVSRFKMSLSHWDAALSAGKPVYVLSNDDAHDLDNPYDYGRCATVIQTTAVDAESVLEALTAGKAYGYVPHCPDWVNHENKREKFTQRPHLSVCDVHDQTLYVEASDTLALARFIGQGGDTLHVAYPQNSSAVQYTLKSQDTYVRAELELRNGDVFYLNPVFRTAAGTPPAPTFASVNWPLTLLLRTGFILLLLTPALRQYVSRRRTRNIPNVGHPTIPDLV